MEYAEIVANPQITDGTFVFPAAIRAKAKPRATIDVPYPNVQRVLGASHNGLIVAMKDYLVVFDAPINEWQSRFTIDAAKAGFASNEAFALVSVT